jgi:hypothetical protein
MIKYAKKVVLKTFNFINTFFNININKNMKNLFKFHFEIMEHFIEFILSCT